MSQQPLKNPKTVPKRPSRTAQQIDAMVRRLHELRHPLESKARTKGLNLHEAEELRHIHAAIERPGDAGTPPDAETERPEILMATEKLTRNLDDAESRAFWEALERRAESFDWPDWLKTQALRRK